MTVLAQQGAAAKHASRILAIAGETKKNAALSAIADTLKEKKAVWLAANAEDLDAAKAEGMRDAMLDRLETLISTLFEAPLCDLPR